MKKEKMFAASMIFVALSAHAGKIGAKDAPGKGAPLKNVHVDMTTIQKTNVTFHGAGNGGDVEKERENKLRAYISDETGGLKADLREYFKNITQGGVEAPAPNVQDMITKMVNGHVDADIQITKYVPSDTCIDETGVERSAATLQGHMAADVCFNLTKLAKLGTTTAELVGLAAHEHSRHFSLDDSEHDLATYVAQTFPNAVLPVNLVFDTSAHLYRIDRSISKTIHLSVISDCKDVAYWNGTRSITLPSSEQLTQIEQEDNSLEFWVTQVPQKQCSAKIRIYDQGKRIVNEDEIIVPAYPDGMGMSLSFDFREAKLRK